jgi:hypothetical protein
LCRIKKIKIGRETHEIHAIKDESDFCEFFGILGFSISLNVENGQLCLFSEFGSLLKVAQGRADYVCARLLMLQNLRQLL